MLRSRRPVRTLRNVVIFICDSLRYDYGHEFLSLFKNSFVIRAITPGLCTPPAIASILTGMSPLVHGVTDFFDELGVENTLLPKFEDFEFYSYMYDPIRRMVLRIKRRRRRIREMSEPFIWVERLMETHYPYGRIIFGRFPDDIPCDLRYFDMLKKKGIDIRKEYLKGVIKAKEHIKLRLVELKLAGLLERTLVIVCSDHGEILDYRYPSPHGYPPCRDLVEVPVIFYPPQRLPRVMRLRDVLPIALNIIGLDSNGHVRRGVRDTWPKRVRVYDICASCQPLRNFFTIWECTEDGARMVGIFEPSSFKRAVKELILKQLESPFKATITAKSYRLLNRKLNLRLPL